MNRPNASEFKERAFDLMVAKLNDVCATLNDENDNFIFYVKDNTIFLDCSDYSPRDVAVFKM
jgi:hypothetical protein|nr:MAG TPA: hypothetical protein [Caudoviricetes sp.]